MALDTEALKSKALGVVKGFSPAQMVIAGLLTVVALVGAFSFFSWVSAPSYTVLYSGLSAKDASAVTTKLTSSGVPYKLTGGGTTVMVPKDKVDAQRVAISAAGIVKGGAVGYELLDKSSITTSSFTQQINLQRAMEGEIARSLQSMDGINSAQVHLVLPQERLFSDETQPARASVLLDTNGLLSRDEVQSIVSLVSSSVADLDPSAVTVTDSDGRLLSSTGGDDSAATNLQHRQSYEDSLAAAAQTMLDRLVGQGHSVVRVSADMDFDKHTTSTSKVEQGTPTSTSETSETYKGTGNGSGTASGPLSTSNTTSTTGNSGSGDYEKTTKATDFGVTQTNDNSTSGGAKVNKLSVAVAVDSSVKTLPPTAQLQALVAAAVGINNTRGDSIVVSTAAFDQTDATNAAGAAAAAKKATGSSGGMMSMVSTGVSALMLLLITLMLVRSVRRPKVTDLEIPAVAGAPLPRGAIPTQASGIHDRYTVVDRPGGAAPESLIGIVEQSPDDVATLLRGWLADTGSTR